MLFLETIELLTTHKYRSLKIELWEYSEDENIKRKAIINIAFKDKEEKNLLIKFTFQIQLLQLYRLKNTLQTL